MSTPTAVTEREDPPAGLAFWIGLGFGGALVVFGIAGLLSTTDLGNGFRVGTWVVGADLVHDLVLAPIAVAASVLLTRLVPLPWRAPIRAALATSAVLLIIAVPPLLGTAHDSTPNNPTVQPLDYPSAVATAIGVVWAAAGLWVVAIALRRRHADG